MERPSVPKGHHLEILLKSRPKDLPKPSETFELKIVQTQKAPYPENHVLVRTLYTSVDPAMRIWMRPQASYTVPVKIGDVMKAAILGEIVGVGEGVKNVKVGDIVEGWLGWREYALVEENEVQVIKGAEAIEKKNGLGVLLGGLGMTGMTAYFGLLHVGAVNKGDVVVISAAAGATGSIACQLAKIQKCTVIGIAGGDEKCKWLKEKIGCDHAIDYKRGEEWFNEELKRVCKDGVDVYFDNVGGWILNSVLGLINMNARVVLCGAISTYNKSTPNPGPSNYINLLMKQGRMEGFIVQDFASKFGDARLTMADWMKEGKLISREQVVNGLEMAPSALLMLFSGKNTGKLIVKVADRVGRRAKH